jgi:hypothetical protein
VNAGGQRVFVERGGRVERVPARIVDEKLLTVAIKNIARTCGDEISEEQPILGARLEVGSRVAAMFPPSASTARRSPSGAFPAGTHWTIWSLLAVCRRTRLRSSDTPSRTGTTCDLGRNGHRKDDVTERPRGDDFRHGSHCAD